MFCTRLRSSSPLSSPLIQFNVYSYPHSDCNVRISIRLYCSCMYIAVCRECLLPSACRITICGGFSRLRFLPTQAVMKALSLCYYEREEVECHELFSLPAAPFGIVAGAGVMMYKYGEPLDFIDFNFSACIVSSSFWMRKRMEWWKMLTNFIIFCWYFVFPLTHQQKRK